MSPVRNYASVAMCLTVIMLTDWSLWLSIPVGMVAGGLVAQIIGQYLPEPSRPSRALRQPPARYS